MLLDEIVAVKKEEMEKSRRVIQKSPRDNKRQNLIMNLVYKNFTFYQ